MKSPTALAATLLLLLAAPAAALADEAALAQGAGCMGCHAKDKKTVGPSIADIAAKYKGDKDAPAKLADKVRKGSTGAWGAIPMPPTPAARIADADLQAVLAWMLKG